MRAPLMAVAKIVLQHATVLLCLAAAVARGQAADACTPGRQAALLVLTSVSAPACLGTELAALAAHIQATYTDDLCGYALAGAAPAGSAAATGPRLYAFDTSARVAYSAAAGGRRTWQSTAYSTPRARVVANTSGPGGVDGFTSLERAMQELLPPLPPRERSARAPQYVILPTPDAGGVQVIDPGLSGQNACSYTYRLASGSVGGLRSPRPSEAALTSCPASGMYLVGALCAFAPAGCVVPRGGGAAAANKTGAAFKAPAARACFPCAAQLNGLAFSPVAGGTACLRCPSGTVAGPGATSCVPKCAAANELAGSTSYSRLGKRRYSSEAAAAAVTAAAAPVAVPASSAGSVVGGPGVSFATVGGSANGDTEGEGGAASASPPPEGVGAARGAVGCQSGVCPLNSILSSGGECVTARDGALCAVAPSNACGAESASAGGERGGAALQLLTVNASSGACREAVLPLSMWLLKGQALSWMGYDMGVGSGGGVQAAGPGWRLLAEDLAGSNVAQAPGGCEPPSGDALAAQLAQGGYVLDPSALLFTTYLAPLVAKMEVAPSPPAGGERSAQVLPRPSYSFDEGAAAGWAVVAQPGSAPRTIATTWVRDGSLDCGGARSTSAPYVPRDVCTLVFEVVAGTVLGVSAPPGLGCPEGTQELAHNGTLSCVPSVNW